MFSCILTLLYIILIKLLSTKAYDRRASGDCGTSGSKWLQSASNQKVCVKGGGLFKIIWIVVYVFKCEGVDRGGGGGGASLSPPAPCLHPPFSERRAKNFPFSLPPIFFTSPLFLLPPLFYILSSRLLPLTLSASSNIIWLQIGRWGV